MTNKSQMASSCSPSSSKPPTPPPQQSPIFTPIRECENKGHQNENNKQGRTQSRATPVGNKAVTSKHYHNPTPLHHTHKINKAAEDDDDGSVSCNKCRPHPREKITVVPLDNNNGLSKSIASPNKIFKSIVSSLTKKSPRPSSEMSPTNAKDEHWKIAVAELSHKLIQATRRRDEAVLEASRLKYSMAELEKKLNKLEVYCYNLKSGLDECNNNNSPYRMGKNNQSVNPLMKYQYSANEKVIETFLVTVSEARSSVRNLSRSLTMQLRHMGGKVFEKITLVLQQYDVRIAFSKNPRSLLGYLEALLNKAFFEDFESSGFEKNGTNLILNPIDRCEANFASFNALQGLTWEDVLSKGTRHFNEEFSRFCDRKMSEIVAMLGWNRAWPEPLLQAFFGASKNVWLVHLLANSVHPGLQIFRVDKGGKFDSVYMEDMGGDKARVLVPTIVRIMAAPGFYVYDSVVKCKVLCRYHNITNSENDKVSTLSPY